MCHTQNVTDGLKTATLPVSDSFCSLGIELRQVHSDVFKRLLFMRSHRYAVMFI